MSVIVQDLLRYKEATSVEAANRLRLRLMEVLVNARLEEEEKRNEKSKSNRSIPAYRYNLDSHPKSLHKSGESFHDRMQRIPMRPDWDDDD
jgi:hypothetical protein